MTTPNQSPSSTPDPLWEEFNAQVDSSAQELEAAYLEIERDNAAMVSQVAGLEDVHLTRGRGLSEGAEEFPDDLVLKPRWQKLYLRPDTQDALHDQGESVLAIYELGDPYVIVGDIPPRSQKLIDDLLASTSSVLDEAASTPGRAIWRGDVAGQPVQFELSKHKMLYHTDPDPNVPPKSKDYHSMLVRRIDE